MEPRLPPAGQPAGGRARCTPDRCRGNGRGSRREPQVAGQSLEGFVGDGAVTPMSLQKGMSSAALYGSLPYWQRGAEQHSALCEFTCEVAVDQLQVGSCSSPHLLPESEWRANSPRGRAKGFGCGSSTGTSRGHREGIGRVADEVDALLFA